MNKSPVFQLFLALSKEEKIACRKFLYSPLHNQRKDVQQLFDYFQTHYTKNSLALRKEQVFYQLFSDEIYDDKKIRYTMSFLLQRMEDFLVWQERKKNEMEAKLLLAKAYKRLNLSKLQSKALRKAEQSMHTESIRGIDIYENNYQLASAQYDAQVGQERNSPLNLQEWSQALDLAFLAKKLRQSCFALAHQAVYRIEYDTGLLPAVLNYLNDFKELEQHPAIALYYYFYQAQTTEEADFYFQKLKKGVVEKSTSLPQEEQHNLYLAAINFCIQQFNRGEEQYLREVFDLYRSGIEQKILLEKGKISRFTYKNVVGVALRLKEFKWAEQFILEYQEALENRFKTNYVHYNLSKLRFHQQNYSEAMQRLQQVEYDDLFLNLDAKVMLLKIYFELKEWEVLDSFTISFQRFLQRKKGLGYHQENYGNFVKLARKLLEINPFNQNQIRKLQKEIIEKKALSEKDWLLRQLEKRLAER